MISIFLVGSYTTPDNAAIRRIEVDCEAPAIRELSPAEGIGNPIYFAIDKAKGRLYVAQASSPDSGLKSSGTLAAYSLDAETRPTLLDSVSFDFTVPCHISLSHDGSKLLFAEYSLAHAGVVELKPDGTFGRHSFVHHEGSGPNKKRQESAHCHCAVASPDDSVMFVCDLGTDTVNAYGLSPESPEMKPLPDQDFHAAPGLGPRHLIFAPGGDRAYLIYELGSAVQAFAYADGRVTPLQKPLSTLPADFAGDTKCAAIRISPCGKWLLASNRGHDSIAAFRILPDGTLDASPAISPLTGTFPRDFVFVDETHVLVGHKLSANIRLYRFDPATGVLAPTEATFSMPRPLAFIHP